MQDKQPFVTLNNGIKIPQLGLGVWNIREGKDVIDAVSTAIETGYRSFDTAAVYGNEHGVGAAIAQSNIPREEIFVTTKLWNTYHGYDSALGEFEKSRQELGLEYIDLYLIHWPVSPPKVIAETWWAFEKLLSEGLVKAIGVSNFSRQNLDDLLSTSEIPPAVNQIELHPYLNQKQLRDYCDKLNIHVESYSPIMRAGIVLDDPAINKIAKKHDRTPAQVILRWHIQHGLIVIPKSADPGRIKENFGIFDFELAKYELNEIDSLDRSRQYN
jgi:diketogulonate reductase-like aldo/keto reductase